MLQLAGDKEGPCPTVTGEPVMSLPALDTGMVALLGTITAGIWRTRRGPGSGRPLPPSTPSWRGS